MGSLSAVTYEAGAEAPKSAGVRVLELVDILTVVSAGDHVALWKGPDACLAPCGVDPAPSGGRALRLSSCHTQTACHGKAASPVVGRAVYALLPEVSFSCPLILLRWQIRLTCEASSSKKKKKKKRALRLSSCHTLIACHGKAASPVVGRAVYALLPEVSFSCPLMLLRWQVRLTCKASSFKI